MFVRLIDNNIQISNVILGGVVSDQKKEMVKSMYLIYKEDKSKLDTVWIDFFESDNFQEKEYELNSITVVDGTEDNSNIMIVDNSVNLEDNELQNRKFFTLNTIKGDKGDIGPVGPKGDVGNGLYIDFVFDNLHDLQKSSSINGKIALDNQTRNYYFRRENTWVKIGVLEGNQGPQGEKGDRGI